MAANKQIDRLVDVIKGLGLLKVGMWISEIGSQIGLQSGLVAFDHKKRIGTI